MDSDSGFKTVAAREAAQAAVGYRWVVEEEMPGQRSHYNQRRPPLPPSFSPTTLCCEWEKAFIHEDQMEGIPISTTGVFPCGVPFPSEETVLFHPVQGANSALLCVCVSVYLVCTVPLTEGTLNKCHPVPRTGTPVQLPQIPAAAHVSVRPSGLDPFSSTRASPARCYSVTACRHHFLLLEDIFLFA